MPLGNAIEDEGRRERWGLSWRVTGQMLNKGGKWSRLKEITHLFFALIKM